MFLYVADDVIFNIPAIIRKYMPLQKERHRCYHWHTILRHQVAILVVIRVFFFFPSLFHCLQVTRKCNFLYILRLRHTRTFNDTNLVALRAHTNSNRILYRPSIWRITARTIVNIKWHKFSSVLRFVYQSMAWSRMLLTKNFGFLLDKHH